MTREQLLLVQAGEECNEIGKRCAKAVRFGLDQIQPEQIQTNRERIMDEYVDLIAVMDQLGFTLSQVFDEQVQRKQDKVEKYLELSRAQGVLTE